MIQKFEYIIAWKKAQDIAVEICSMSADSKNYGFKDQICRAAVSISNNITEGFERNTNPDFNRFLFIALGSCSELKSMSYLAQRINLRDNVKVEKLINQCDEISKINYRLIKTLKPPLTPNP